MINIKIACIKPAYDNIQLELDVYGIHFPTSKETEKQLYLIVSSNLIKSAYLWFFRSSKDILEMCTAALGIRRAVGMTFTTTWTWSQLFPKRKCYLSEIVWGYLYNCIIVFIMYWPSPVLCSTAFIALFTKDSSFQLQE